jgi:hypothetical protein
MAPQDAAPLDLLEPDADEETYLAACRAQVRRIVDSPEFLAEEAAALERGHDEPQRVEFDWTEYKIWAEKEARRRGLIQPWEFIDNLWRDLWPRRAKEAPETPDAGTERAPDELAPGRAGGNPSDSVSMYGAILKAAERLVAEESNRSDGPLLFETVRDVLHGSVTGPCRMGKRASLTWRENPRISNRYLYCWGFKCPRCAPDQVVQHVGQTLRAWEGELEQVHRLELGEREWETSKRAKRIRGEYARRYVRIRQAAGGYVVFVPGPAEGGEPVPVEELGRALVEVVLGAPAAGRRFTWATRTREGEKALLPREEEREEREKAKRVNLPKDVSPEDANALYEEALDRPLGWVETGPGQARECWQKWDAEDLSREEIDYVRETVQEPLGERERQEREDLKRWAELAATWDPEGGTTN